MGILTNRLFLDDEFSDLGPGQGTMSSMMSGLQAGPMGRSMSAGLGSSGEVIGQVPVDGASGASGGVSPLQMIGEQLGLSPERMDEILAYKGRYTSQKGNLGLQGAEGNYVRSLGKDGGGRDELLRDPVAGRDGGPRSAAEWDAQQKTMGRDAAGFSMVKIQDAAKQHKATEADNRQFYKDIGGPGGDSPSLIFHNLSKIPEEQLSQIDFSDEDVLQNLSKPNFESRIEMYSRGGKDGVMDALTESNKASGMGVYGAAILPKVISTGIGLINPIAGAAANAFIGGATTGDWSGSLKNAGIGLATSLAGSAIGGGFSGAQAGTGVGEGALSGLKGAVTSDALSSMGSTMTGSGAGASIEDLGGPYASIEAAQKAGKGGIFSLQDAMTSSGDFAIPGVTNAGANLDAAQAGAGKDMAKKFGTGLFQSAIGPLSSLFQSDQQSAGGQGAFIGNEGAFENIFGIKESGMGFLDPISEQQISGIGVN